MSETGDPQITRIKGKGQRAEETEDGGQRAEVGGQWSEDGGQWSEVGSREGTDVGGLKSEVSGQGSGKVGVKKKESKALKRMRKQIREYVWNFYPDPQITQIFAD